MSDSIDMRNQDSVIFCCGNMTISIKYSFVGFPSIPSKVEAVVGSYCVALNWSDVFAERGYLIYRDGLLMGTTASNCTSYIDSTYFHDGAFFGEHCYNISAINYCGESSISPSVCETLYLVQGFTFANHNPLDTLKGVRVYIWEKPAQSALSEPELEDSTKSDSLGCYRFKVPRGIYWVFRDPDFFQDTTLSSYSIVLPEDSEGDSLVGLNFDSRSGIEDSDSERKSPRHFCLFQNYPNPFNPKTDIRYYLPVEAFVKIKIFNILGQNVRVLLEERESEGYHAVCWDGENSIGEDVGSGIYYYRMQTPSFSETKKMLLLR